MRTPPLRPAIPHALRQLASIKGDETYGMNDRRVSTEAVQRLAHEAIAELLRAQSTANAAPPREAVSPPSETGS